MMHTHLHTDGMMPITVILLCIINDLSRTLATPLYGGIGVALAELAKFVVGQFAVSIGCEHELWSCSNIVFFAGSLNVFVDGISADPDNLANLPVGFALCDERRAFPLTGGQDCGFRSGFQRKDPIAMLKRDRRDCPDSDLLMLAYVI